MLSNVVFNQICVKNYIYIFIELLFLPVDSFFLLTKLAFLCKSRSSLMVVTIVQ